MLLLFLPLLQLFTSSFYSEVLVILGIILVILIVFTLGRFIVGLIVNSVLGLIAIYLVNALFGLGIPYNLPVLVATAIFGLPAVAIIIILKLGGVI